MSAENITKRCRDCTLGRQSSLGALNPPIKSEIPLSIMIPPRIERNCLSRFEVIKNSVLSKIEDAIEYDIPIERNEHVVTFSAKCMKPDSYTPRE